MSAVEQSSMKQEHWIERWDKGETGWHKDDVHPILEKYFEELRICAEDASNINVFVPLCGKTMDMLWLAKKGVSVTGVECSQKGVQQFFTENSLEYACTNSNVYTASKYPIQILCQDIFSICAEGSKFDFIWDRGSFVALNVADRQNYLQLLSTLLKPSGRILMVTMDYEPLVWPGPPHYIKRDEFHSIIATSPFSSKFLEENDVITDNQKNNWGLEFLNETSYVLQIK